jgi:hypothetical protein
MLDPTEKPHRFTIAAIDLRMLIDRLKPALKRGRAPNTTYLAMEVEPGRLRWILPGATAATVAQSETSFRVEVPLPEVHWIVEDKFRDGEVIAFEFDNGRMSYRGVGIERPDIQVLPPESTDRPAVRTNRIDAPEPDGVIGLPLFASYCAIRRVGPAGLSGNVRLQDDARQIEN